uniref:Uncharacterized protein n=1 Tax=Nelumbo nucifera TaxID=4432 RepID=A0A822YDB0_NELNU|nr:TPA_asm: hypothetical protein HUJ06_030747 [Nelumbo nucifera]
MMKEAPPKSGWLRGCATVFIVLQILVPTSSEEVVMLDDGEDEEEGASSNQELVLEIRSFKSNVAQLTKENIYLRSFLPSQAINAYGCLLIERQRHKLGNSECERFFYISTFAQEMIKTGDDAAIEILALF